MSKPSKAHTAAAKHLLRYLTGTVDFAVTYKQGGFKLTAFSDANCDNNPDNGKSMSSYVAFLANAPVSFKVGWQGLTAQSTMEEEFVAAALAMKEAVFCSNKDEGTGIRHALRQRATIYRQHLGYARRRKSDLPFAS